jgi:hydroxymethylbilane synthase
LFALRVVFYSTPVHTSGLVLGTRGSSLALAQSGTVKRALEARGYRVRLEIIQTRGDRDQSSALSRIGGKGLFTKELDLALLGGEIDLAVHSLKDLPTDLEGGIAVAAVPEREDPRDVLIGPEGKTPAPTLHGLAAGSRLGTSSLRRRALARAFRPDLAVDNVRGNLDTRIGKVDRGEYDAILVAAAGVRRLGLWHRVAEALERTAWLPAPGQGALALVARADDAAVQRTLRPLDHRPSHSAVRAERALLSSLGGGCQTPVAALGLPYDSGLRLWALVASPDGARVVRADGTGSLADPESLGAEVGDVLMKRGAGEVLELAAHEAALRLSHP